MKTAVCRAEKRGTPTPRGEVENNSMSRAAHGPQELVDAGRAPLKTPGEAWISPRRRSGALEHGAHSNQGRAHRTEADALIARAENLIVRANMAASVRRALRAPTKARCVLRALETRRVGRMANGERRISQEPFSLFALRTSPLARTRILPSARGWRPSPWRRHTLVWSPLGDVSTQAGAKA
jgi:hypothetical protein